jgi:hypothetical protein
MCTACLATALATPSFLKARRQAQMNQCSCVLHCLDSAQEQAGIELNLKNGDLIEREKVLAYFKNAEEHLRCPAVGRDTYTFGKLGESPRCSFHTNLILGE